MNALAIGCFAVTGLLWGAAALLLVAMARATTGGVPWAVQWRTHRHDLWTLGCVGALFGLTALALWGLG